MIKICPLLAALALTACAHQTFQEVELGMNQEEVVTVAGKPDSVIAAYNVDDVSVEIFEYQKGGGLWWGNLDESYWFYFVDGKLEKWERPGDYFRYVDTFEY